ncbi:diguanylate cyclase [Paenibacillus sp. NPDC056579]|uniref:diguanylate cyclase n=1 Tax=Paenibacillus sp. NPDC056579 TaxID=3345871 RepID=UPI00367829DF
MTKDLIVNLALLTAFIFLSSRLLKPAAPLGLNDKAYRWKVGALHGLFGIVLMYFSVHIDNVTILDLRQIIILAAAQFGGIHASLLSGIIIGLGRITLFGGMNKSSLTAAATALIVGAGSGMIAHYIQHYWKRWMMSIFMSALVISGSLFWLFDMNPASHIIVSFTTLITLGGLFVAGLIRHLHNADELVVQLERSEARYRRLASLHEAIFHAPSDLAFLVTDERGKVTMFNSGAEKMLGYRAQETVDKLTVVLLAQDREIALVPEDEAGYGERPKYRSIVHADPLMEAEIQGEAAEKEWTFTKQGGQSIDVSVMISQVRENGSSMNSYLFVIADVTQKKLAEAKLMEANRMLCQLSRLDGLTQIPNRRSLDESLRECWDHAVSHSQALSFILLDIDYFKRYNDTYSHLGGDQCLKQVAAAIAASVRQENDYPARYGGEEFAVILPATKLEQAMQAAENIREAVAALRIQHIGSKAGQHLTVSLGVASIIPYPGAEPQDIVSMADKALYRAKQEGRNRACRYHP